MPIDRDSAEFLRLRLTFANNEIRKMWKYREEKTGNCEVDPRDVARVRRALFGPPDPEGNSRFLEEEVRRLEIIERKRWGFDFKVEAPLPGYQLELKKPKARRLGQQKMTDYLPTKKTAESQKKLKLILENIKDEDLEEMQVSS